MPAPYQRILVPTDFSETAELAVRRAKDLAERFHAELYLVHVVAHFPQDLGVDWIPPENEDPKHFYLEQARRHLQALDERLGLGAARQAIFSPHSARHEIVAYAREKMIDLIVIGSHGHGTLAALFGSTAAGVVRDAPCDVLVVRPRA